jgi:hypothetical protein
MITSVTTGISLADRVKALAGSFAHAVQVVLLSVETGYAVNRQYNVMVAVDRNKPVALRQSDSDICREAIENGVKKPAA